MWEDTHAYLGSLLKGNCRLKEKFSAACSKRHNKQYLSFLGTKMIIWFCFGISNWAFHRSANLTSCFSITWHATLIALETSLNTIARGGLRGGGTLGKCQGPRAFGGARSFFGLRGCLCRHVFIRDRTRFGWTYYICIGALGPHVLISFYIAYLFV